MQARRSGQKLRTAHGVMRDSQAARVPRPTRDDQVTMSVRRRQRLTTGGLRMSPHSLCAWVGPSRLSGRSPRVATRHERMVPDWMLTARAHTSFKASSMSRLHHAHICIASRFTGLGLGLAMLIAIAPATSLAQKDAPARNGRFTVVWKPAPTEGPVRISGEAKGILVIATHSDSAIIRIEMTQRADGQPSSTVQTFPGQWRGDTLVFTQTVESQVNADGQQMPMTAYSDWRVLIVGDELRGTVALHLPGISLDVPPFVVTGRRESSREAVPQQETASPPFRKDLPKV